MGLEPIRLTAADFKSAQSTEISALAVSPGWETWTLNAFALGFEPSPYTNSGNPGNILLYLKELKSKAPAQTRTENSRLQIYSFANWTTGAKNCQFIQ